MLARSLIVVVNLALLGVVAWGTVQQISTQKETNQTMAKVHRNINKAKELTTATNERLEPLRATADSIEDVNAKLDRTNGMLKGMNVNLAGVVKSEQKIVTGLDGLNGNTRNVISRLEKVSAQNERLLLPSSQVAAQTRQEYETLERLYQLTGTSITELSKVNRKFAWVGLLSP